MTCALVKLIRTKIPLIIDKTPWGFRRHCRPCISPRVSFRSCKKGVRWRRKRKRLVCVLCNKRRTDDSRPSGILLDSMAQSQCRIRMGKSGMFNFFNFLFFPLFSRGFAYFYFIDMLIKYYFVHLGFWTNLNVFKDWRNCLYTSQRSFLSKSLGMGYYPIWF